MTKLEKGFGPHLMLDCRQCNYAKISDLGYVWDFLNDLPEQIGMTKIIQPYVFPYSGLIPEDKGITGMVVIAESHLTFHSFTEKDYFFFDLFSCKPFDTERVVELVTEHFEVKSYERHDAFRGLHFPHTMDAPQPADKVNRLMAEKILKDQIACERVPSERVPMIAGCC